MNYKRENKMGMLYILVFCLVVLSVAIASVSTSIVIGGSVNSDIRMDIKFTSFSVTDSNNIIHDALPTLNGTDISDFDVTLLDPGSFVEYTGVITNNSTMDAHVQFFELAGLEGSGNASLAPYLHVTFKYDNGDSFPTIVNNYYRDNLLKNQSKTVKLRIELDSNASFYDISRGGYLLDNLRITIRYAQGVNQEVSSSTLDARPTLSFKNAISDKDLNFSLATGVSGSESGVFMVESTKNDNYPIYYYRGDVQNNYVNFAGKCFQIIRTTDTGGLKMILNNNDSTQCNPTGSAYRGQTFGSPHTGSTVIFDSDGSQSSGSRYYSFDKSGYAYMYNSSPNAIYSTYGTYSGEYLYSMSINSNNTLPSATTGVVPVGAYTCFSSDGSCYQKRYVLNKSGNNYIYLVLPYSGANINNWNDYMGTNSNYIYGKHNYSSTVKSHVDSWYSDFNYSDRNNLEQIKFCNERHVTENTFDRSSFSSTYLYYDSYYVYNNSQAPKLNCYYSSDNITSYAGMITLDEAKMAGLRSGNGGGGNYSWLNANTYFHTMTPAYYDFSFMGSNPYGPYHFYITYTTIALDRSYSAPLYVRPVISLKKGFKIESGNGTLNNPYVFAW